MAITTQMININLRWYMLIPLPSQDSCRDTDFAAAARAAGCATLFEAHTNFNFTLAARSGCRLHVAARARAARAARQSSSKASG